MAINKEASLVNMKHSLEKFLYDNFETVYSIPVIVNPFVERTQNIDRFVVMSLKENNLMKEGQQDVTFYLNQRFDPSGFKLLEIRDALVGVLRDRAGEIKQIPFYDCTDLNNPIEFGLLGIQVRSESMFKVAEDMSAYKSIDVTLMYGN